MKSLVGIVLLSLLSVSAYAETATFRVSIESNWSQASHLALPGNAHFSPVVAVAHNSGYTLLPVGGVATSGLESLAETGQTRQILAEIDQEASSIGDLAETENQFVLRQPVQQFEVIVSEDHPYLSLVSMIAPSPDWVVGVSNLKLYTKDAGFTERAQRLPLYAINAGTEEGDVGGNFGLRNQATEPREAIGQLTGNGFEEPFAYLSLSRLK